MATVPTGYVGGQPDAKGVIPLYDAATGKIAGTIANGKTSILGSGSPESEKSAAYAFPSEIGVSGAASGAAASGGSYLSSSGGASNMTWDDVSKFGYTAQDLAAFQARGWTPDQVYQSVQKGQAAPPSAAAATTPTQNAFGISQVETNPDYNVYQTASGARIAQDNAGNYFGIDPQGNHVPISDADAVKMGFQSANPETQALTQMQQIDPASEALRQKLGMSYLDPLSTAAAGGPTAQQLQSYLDTYQQTDPAGYAQKVALGQGVTGQVSQAGDFLKQAQNYVTQVTGQAPTSATDALAKYQQLDPKGYASMVALGSAQDASLKQAADQLALGSQLDPVTQRQVEQATRSGQAARGNVYGTPQMVSEAMTTGQAGLALQAQRQQAATSAEGAMQSYLTSGATPGAVGQAGYQQGLSNLQSAYGLQGAALGTQQSALGAQQSYLQSGQTLGDTALNLYNQNQTNLANQQQLALSYLGSGQTPYQTGSNYVTGANNAASSAAQGGVTYNPASLGQSYTGTSTQAPQYGLDVGAQSQNWYNSLSSTTGTTGTATKDKTVAAATGALSGAAAGATAGSVVPVYGTAVGAVVGGVAGGLGGYYS